MKLPMIACSLASALLLSGCYTPLSAISASQRATGVVVDDTVRYGAGSDSGGVSEESSRRLRELLDRAERDRQRDWHRYNRNYPGGQPGWSRGPGGFGLLASSEIAPPSSAEYRELCRLVAKTYGLRERAAWHLMEALNRAAVGDFGGFQNLGLEESSFSSLAKNGGLNKKDLRSVAARLGLSEGRANALIQHITRRM